VHATEAARNDVVLREGLGEAMLNRLRNRALGEISEFGETLS
jgi:hypothetical protein